MSMSGQQDPFTGTYAFNPYAVGRRVYQSGSFAPNPGGPVDPTGYVDRSARNQQKRNAYLAWLKSRNAGAYASPDAQRLSGGLS